MISSLPEKWPLPDSTFQNEGAVINFFQEYLDSGFSCSCLYISPSAMPSEPNNSLISLASHHNIVPPRASQNTLSFYDDIDNVTPEATLEYSDDICISRLTFLF